MSPTTAFVSWLYSTHKIVPSLSVDIVIDGVLVIPDTVPSAFGVYSVITPSLFTKTVTFSGLNGSKSVATLPTSSCGL